MMTLIEDLRYAVRMMWQWLGFAGSARTAAAVVPALVLGLGLNLVALNVVDQVRASRGKTQMATLARTELKVVQAAVTLALRQIGNGQCMLSFVRQWAPVQQWVPTRQYEAVRYGDMVGPHCVASQRSMSPRRMNMKCNGEGPARSMRLAYPDATGHFGTL